MVVGFVAINQFSRDSVTSVHVCPKSYATHATLSVQVWGVQEVVLQVILLRLLWMREELQVQQSSCSGVKLWSRRSRLKFPLLHCIVQKSLEGAEKLHNLFTSVVMRQSL